MWVIRVMTLEAAAYRVHQIDFWIGDVKEKLSEDRLLTRTCIYVVILCELVEDKRVKKSFRVLWVALAVQVFSSLTGLVREWVCTAKKAMYLPRRFEFIDTCIMCFLLGMFFHWKLWICFYLYYFFFSKRIQTQTQKLKITRQKWRFNHWVWTTRTYICASLIT